MFRFTSVPNSRRRFAIPVSAVFTSRPHTGSTRAVLNDGPLEAPLMENRAGPRALRRNFARACGMRAVSSRRVTPASLLWKLMSSVRPPGDCESDGPTGDCDGVGGPVGLIASVAETDIG